MEEDVLNIEIEIEVQNDTPIEIDVIPGNNTVEIETSVENIAVQNSNVMSDEELERREKELLGNGYILPTLEEANVVFQLGDQEGPLDVLLEMIKSTKLDIMEIRLADLTEQFIKYMQSMPFKNMEQESEFVVIASKLLEIKAHNLLPCEDEEGGIEDEEDPEVWLKKRLQIYKLFKDASANLATMENNDHFYKEPDKSANDYRVVLKNMNMQGLVDAFSKLMLVAEKKANPTSNERQIQKDRFTLADSIVNMRSMLTDRKKIRFNDFFQGDFTRGEIITTFQAMLELLKAQFASAEQSEVFGEINIILREDKLNEQERTGENN
ncbi:MAG: segregation/condensation protein A [Clostridia bacterium]|nr:segregation/condensation protein A [Clostridia bacterium]